MIVEETTYLEHFGKKGMKWGRRNSKSKTTQPSRKSSNSPSRKDIAIIIGGTALIGGVAIAAAILRNSGRLNISASEVARSKAASEGKAEAIRIIRLANRG